jgi:hypothetical protein
MTNYPILATHYGPDAAWLFGSPLWGIALIVCFMAAEAKSFRVVATAGGIVAFFMIVTTYEAMRYRYDNDAEMAAVGDLAAGGVLMALNFFCTRDKGKFPRSALQKMGSGAWPLSAFFVFLIQLLAGLGYLLLIRLFFRK